MKISGRVFAAALAACVTASTVFAQGLTTGAVQGSVVDESGRPLAGATIEVTDKTTGYVARATSRESGVYFVPGLNVGTSYTVAVRHIGFSPQSRDDIVVQLSLSTRVDFTLATAAAQLSAVKVTGAAEEGAFSID
ncbi:MAG TPA: carboxypeptidase-like regulatory domain-containing protein, partial [Gemmatimonadaceae bacterium]|nr:carboxypeptidase-like regulatory domain-containing protein [Gemmatimonadaceae bacterium]